MQRRYSPDETIHPEHSLAHEESIPFSDLRANTDVRLMRLWIDGETNGHSWKSLDIARGGRSIVTKLESTEHSNTQQNANLLRQVSRSAFTLYQHDRLTDNNGNIVAIALPRNATLQLGRLARGHFAALRGTDIMDHHMTMYVDNDDQLGIEAYSDHLPQIEVIAADSSDAVQIGLAPRNYLRPPSIGAEGVTLISRPRGLDPLHAAIQTIPPQFESIPTDGPMLTDEQLEELLHA